MTLTLSSSFDVRVPPHHLTFPGDRVFLPGIKLLQSFRVQLIASLPGDAAFATFDGGQRKNPAEAGSISKPCQTFLAHTGPMPLATDLASVRNLAQTQQKPVSTPNALASSSDILCEALRNLIAP